MGHFAGGIREPIGRRNGRGARAARNVENFARDDIDRSRNPAREMSLDFWILSKAARVLVAARHDTHAIREIVGHVEEKGGKRTWEPQVEIGERERDEVRRFIMQETLEL